MRSLIFLTVVSTVLITNKASAVSEHASAVSDLECMAEMVHANARIVDTTELVKFRPVTLNSVPNSKNKTGEAVIQFAKAENIQYEIHLSVELVKNASNWTTADADRDVMNINARLVSVTDNKAEVEVLASNFKKSDSVQSPFEMGQVQDGRPLQVLMNLRNPAIDNLVVNGKAASAKDAVLKNLLPAWTAWESNLLCVLKN